MEMSERTLQVVDLNMSDNSLYVAWGDEPGAVPREVPADVTGEIDGLVAELSEAEHKAQEGGSPTVLQAAQRALGLRLHALLDGPERALARRELEARRSARQLRLVIRLLADDESSLAHHLAVLWRWEHIASEHGPLALDPQVRLGVQLGEFDPHRGDRPRSQQKLRLLFMACSAYDAAPVLDYEQEEESLTSALADFVAAGRVMLRVVEEGSLERLRASLMGDAFDVVHLTGHGLLTEAGPRFVMEDATGARQDADADDLLRAFRAARQMPFLVVISSCWSTGGRDGLPSLAARLVAGGVPSVIGWVRPVRDDVATKTACDLYERICVGESPLIAAGYARQRLYEDEERRPWPSHAWGTFQLLTREAPGPSLELTADTTAPASAPEHLHRMLGRSMRVLARGFVGRRRELQRLMRLLREGTDCGNVVAGAVISGMKGQGKSCLVGHALKRHVPTVGRDGAGGEVVVIGGELNDAAVLDAFRERAMAWKDDAAEKVLADGKRTMVERVARLLRGHWIDRRMVIVLDDFEANLDIPGTGLARLDPVAVSLLEAIVPVCVDGHPKILITSTARFTLPARLQGYFAEVDLGALDAASVRKLWLRGQESGELAHVPPSQWTALAERLGRNARVLDWARQLLSGKTPREVEEIVRRAGMELLDWKTGVPDDAQQTDLAAIFLRSLSYDEARIKVGSDALTFVQRARVFDTPVPQEAFVGLTADLAIDLDLHLPALANLGLLESGSDRNTRVYRVSPLVERRFDAPEAERWHLAAARYFQRRANLGSSYRASSVIEAWAHALAAGDQDIADWAAALMMVGLDSRGDFSESLVFSRRHLARFPDSAAGTCWEGFAAFRSGELTLARARLLRAEELASQARIPANLRDWVRDATARVLTACGDLRGARTRFEELIAAEETAPVHGRGSLAIMLHELGTVLLHLGDLAAAQVHMERALEIKEDVFSATEPADIAVTLQGLATVLTQQGDLTRAHALLTRALELQCKAWDGDNHVDIATSLHALATVLRAQGDLDGAWAALERALEILRRLLRNEEHVLVAAVLYSMGSVLHAQGDHAGARVQLTRALEILRRSVKTEEHLDIAACRYMLAAVCREEGDLAGARSHLEGSLKIKWAVLGTDDHPDVATSLHDLAVVDTAEGRIEDATTRYRQALGIRERVFKTRSHPLYAETEVALAAVLVEGADSSEAMQLFEHARSVLREHAPDHHLLPQLDDALNVDGMPSVPELAQMAIQARRTNQCPPPEFQAGLTWLRDEGPPHDFGADFLEIVALGKVLPPIPQDLPEPIRDLLSQVARAAGRGGTIDLGALTGRALAARRGTPMPEADQAVIALLGEKGSLYASIAKFLETLAVHGQVPEVPPDLPQVLLATLANAREQALAIDAETASGES